MDYAISAVRSLYKTAVCCLLCAPYHPADGSDRSTSAICHLPSEMSRFGRYSRSTSLFAVCQMVRSTRQIADGCFVPNSRLTKTAVCYRGTRQMADGDFVERWKPSACHLPSEGVHLILHKIRGGVGSWRMAPPRVRRANAHQTAFNRGATAARECAMLRPVERSRAAVTVFP